MASLFDEYRLKDVMLKNRIVVSPMCQYSSDNGFPNDWHLVHLGSRAVGGASLIVVEATAVSPDGRISPADSGIYLDDHVEPFARITRFLKQHGAVPGMQLAHAGRKASTQKPWEGGRHIETGKGGWDTIAPSAVAAGAELPKIPKEMTLDDIARVQQSFVAAAQRAAGGWLRVARTALRPRLSRSRVLFAARQPADRPVRRQFRQPHSLLAGDVRRRPPGLAGAISADRATFGDRLDRGRRDRGRFDRAGAATENGRTRSARRRVRDSSRPTSRRYRVAPDS